MPHLLVLFDRQQQVSMVRLRSPTILSGVGENFSGVLYVRTNNIAPLRFGAIDLKGAMLNSIDIDSSTIIEIDIQVAFI